MKLSAAFRDIALRLQEAATSDLSLNDLRIWLSGACSERSKEGQWCYLVDIFGDSGSGDVIVSMNGELMRCPYEVTTANGKSAALINWDAGESVLPRTVYEPEADEGDSMASLEALRGNVYSDIPVYERMISQGERKAADSSSFAGKGRSFPILKPSDVMAAVRSLGRAGSENFDTATLKRNIIRIAKAKGWEKELPKAWQTKESAQPAKSGSLALVESAATLEPIVLREARADYEIKLIAPGKGSSAFYPAEVLKRDGPKVFQAGTHVYLNHPTAAEEAARPEGDVKNLAGVLTTAAEFREAHPKGPGLYARMKVFADHAQVVEEKAAHVGMSIRASGVAESGKTREGLPILKELTGAESVDVVTHAGAGGMILTEAARAATSQTEKEASVDMDAAELQKLQESVGTAQKDAQAARAEAKALRQRLALSEARDVAAGKLATIQLPEAAKQRILGRVVAAAPINEKDELDTAKLGEMVTVEAKAESEYIEKLTGGRVVVGMGAANEQPPDPKKQAAEHDQVMGSLCESMGITSEAGKKAFMAREGRA